MGQVLGRVLSYSIIALISCAPNFPFISRRMITVTGVIVKPFISSLIRFACGGPASENDQLPTDPDLLTFTD